MQYIAFDCHKRYTWAVVKDERGTILEEGRIDHTPGALREFLVGCEPGSPVAVETVGNWYWIVDEIEKAGFEPRLVHAGKAKLMRGMVNKTDKLDARGLNKLQRAGTLPTVWISPGELRDQRELPRARDGIGKGTNKAQAGDPLHLGQVRERVETSDLFGVKGREVLANKVRLLPSQTKYVTEGLVGQIEALDERIKGIEDRMRQVLLPTEEVRLLESLPRVGFILAVVIGLEVGDVGRFPSAEHLASYAGTVPRVHASGGKTRYGRTRQDVNQYLKGAYFEAGNVVARHHKHPTHRKRHVSRLYGRIVKKKGHQVAVGAVERHLAEATWWILVKGEPYRAPALKFREDGA